MKNIKEEIEKTVKSCEIVYMVNKHFDSNSTKEMIEELVMKIVKLFESKNIEKVEKNIKQIIHTHEKMSEIYNIPDTKCVIDVKFASGFKNFEYFENDIEKDHIIVSVEEYNAVVLRRSKYEKNIKLISKFDLSTEHQLKIIQDSFGKTQSEINKLFDIISVTYPYLSEILKIDLVEDILICKNTYINKPIAYCVEYVIENNKKYQKIE